MASLGLNTQEMLLEGKGIEDFESSQYRTHQILDILFFSLSRTHPKLDAQLHSQE